MRYLWIDDYLMAKPAVTKDLKAEWNWIRYMIDGKMFAAVLLDRQNEPYFINLKLDPEEGDFLRRQYEDIIPGYYSNKRHWNSIKPDGLVPDDLLRDLLDKSYALVARGLSRKRRQAVLVTTYCGLSCEGCVWREKTGCQGCVATKGFAFHCKEEACPVAACAQEKGVAFCGECAAFPCQRLKDYSYDKDYGDVPPGARIEACRLIGELMKK